MRGHTMFLLIVTVLSVFPSSVKAGKRSEERRQGKLPRFLPAGHNVSAFPGGEVLLPCAVEGLGRHTVVWMNQAQEIPHVLFVGVEEFTTDKRFRLLHEGSDGVMWNLQITSVRIRDEGFYECQVNTQPPMRHKVFLHVPRVPPTTAARPSVPTAFVYLDPTEVIREQGSALTLRCNGSHSPLEWYKDGTKIDTSGRGAVNTEFVQDSAFSELIIESLQLQDAGTYVCRGGGTAKSATVHVLTEKAPEAVKSAACTPLPTITAILLLSTRWLQGMRS